LTDGLSNEFGCIRLKFVRNHYGLHYDSINKEWIQDQEFSPKDLTDLTNIYRTWRDKDEIAPVKLVFKDYKVYNFHDTPISADKWAQYRLETTGGYVYVKGETVFFESELSCWSTILLSKRGNKKYIEQIKEKLKPLFLKPSIMFFDSTFGRKVTPMLYTTLEWDSNKYSISEAWRTIGHAFNNYLSKIKQKYGKIEFLRVWQTHESGYPHIHMLIYFKKKSFEVFEHTSKKGKRSFRLPYNGQDLKFLKNSWKYGYSDYIGVDDTKEGLKDLLKYITRDLKGGKSDLTNTMVWIYGKQAIGISKNFMSEIWGSDDIDLTDPGLFDEINSIKCNSNMELLRIEVFPAIPQDLLDYSYQPTIFNYADLPDPPPNVVNFLENYAFSCSRLISEKKRDDGVKIIVYGRE
jgi:hypothetical protein